VLDLDGNGVRTTAAADGVNFDLNATGNAQRVGWASATDGLLVMDRNGDGRINDGSELFGTGTRDAAGSRAVDGYQAMRFEDSNGDGLLSAADARFSELQVWVDANQDGKTDAGELQGLVDLGIVSLDLGAAAGTQVDNGNLLGLVSHYTTVDGSQHQMADVWFTKDTSAPSIGELLSGPAHELLTGSAPTAGAATSGGASAAPAHVRWPDLADPSGTPLI
jgi:trimeric autotransporter adhesin